MVKNKHLIMIAALMYAAVMGTWAQTAPEGLSIDTDYDSDEEGYYYVNMPTFYEDSRSITFSSTDLVFKVYDDGGKNGPTSIGYSNSLTFIAPEGYCFEIEGRYELGDDEFIIYNSSSVDYDNQLFYYEYDETGDSGPRDISIRRTTNNGIHISFVFQNSYGTPGFELTVRIKPLHVFRGEGTEASPYEIWSSEAWEYLRTKLAEDEAYASKYYKQMRDFEVTQSIGTKDRAFTGHYDGNGHSIACTMSASGEATAPFYRVIGAEIKNLHVTGTISGGIHTAGLVAFSSGTNSRTSIENCCVSATITCKGNAINNAHGGGFIGHAEESEYALTDCLFDGKLIAGENNGRGDMHLGAFVGWAGSGTRIINSSIEKGTYEGADKSRIAFCWQNDNSYKPNSYGGNFYFSDLGHSDGAEKLVSVDSGTEDLELNFGSYTWKDVYHGAMKKATSEVRYLIDDTFYTISGGSASFYLNCPAMWDVTSVQANGNEVTSVYEGMYTISNITEPVTITLEHGYTYWTDEGNYASEFSSVKGSTITITSKEELARLAYLVNTGADHGSGKTYKLDKNLEMSEKAWKPIGNISHRFLGIFDGQGYTISGINVKEGNSQYVGLFGMVNGTVRNVRLEKSSIEGKRYVGGIAGDARYDIINCHVADNVVVTAVAVEGDNDSGKDCGGVVGNLISQGSNNHGYPETDAYVRGCYSAATVKGVSHVGGIVGNMAQNTTGQGTVHYNVSEAKVTATGNDGSVAYIVGNKSGGTMLYNFYISDSESDNSNDVRAYRITLTDELKGYGFLITGNTNENFDVSKVSFSQYTIYDDRGIRQFKVGDEWYAPMTALAGGSNVTFNFSVAHQHQAAMLENVKVNGTTPSTTSSGYGFEVTGDAVITGDLAVMLYDNSDGNDTHEGKNNLAILGYTNGLTANVTLQDRTFYKDGNWNTVCLPFDHDISDADSPFYGASVRTLQSSEFNQETRTLTLTFADYSSKILAGVPYIIKWSGGYGSNIENPKFKDVTIKYDSEDAPIVIGSDDKYPIEFYGNYVSANFPQKADGYRDYLYLGADDKLYYPDGTVDVTINSFRAYFKLKNGYEVSQLASEAPTGIRFFVLDFGDGEETAIGEIVNSQSSNRPSAWYTLDGRRLNGKPSRAGVYINNGIKVVIK